MRIVTYRFDSFLQLKSLTVEVPENSKPDDSQLLLPVYITHLSMSNNSIIAVDNSLLKLAGLRVGEHNFFSNKWEDLYDRGFRWGESL